MASNYLHCLSYMNYFFLNLPHCLLKEKLVTIVKKIPQISTKHGFSFLSYPKTTKTKESTTTYGTSSISNGLICYGLFSMALK